MEKNITEGKLLCDNSTLTAIPIRLTPLGTVGANDIKITNHLFRDVVCATQDSSLLKRLTSSRRITLFNLSNDMAHTLSHKH